MQYLFNESIVDLRNELLFNNVKTFEKDCENIDKTIDDIYESNDSDIEDFSDLLIIINNYCYNILKNNEYNKENKLQITELRLKAKRKAKQKYRDFKYDNRRFWNCNEAHQHYHELVEFVWKPSVKELKEIIELLSL